MSLRDMALTLGFALALLASPLAYTESRALLIGIGKYQNSRWNLPGIDLDIANMKDMAQIMGFKPEEMRVLMDGEANSARVKREMSTWLRNGVGPDDRVLIYFSGHGTRIPDEDGDESDGADETLILYDSRFGRRTGAGAPTMVNSLVDDEVAALVSRIPSRRVLMIVDACHSGTITRDVNFEQLSLGEKAGVRKFLYYDGMPASGGIEKAVKSTEAESFVALSAADDTQAAISTFQGGVFTLGLVKSLREAARDGRNITLEELRKEVSTYIDGRMQPSLRFTPVISGNAAMAEGGLNLVALRNSNGPAWRELMELSANGERLALRSNQSRYALGEEVRLRINVPREGYLNVVTVDSQDSATVLFPNRFHPENLVKAGDFAIPGVDMPFVLPAQEPTGQTLVVAFLSPHPVNLLTLGIEGRDKEGQFSEAFTEPTKLATLNIGEAAKAPSFSAGALEVSVDSRRP
jgi:metacaspase-1